jgi:formylglycine-generating enzyme required for sulfatase activity
MTLIEPKIVEIPAGTVVLGAPDFPEGCVLPHKWTRQEVHVGRFGIATCAVTVAEMLAFASSTGYAIANELRADQRFSDPKAPAAYISWIDATHYVNSLARQTGKPYRLVRDAEYEKAARGGLVGKRFPWGDEPPAGRADYNNPAGSPRPVGSFEPNGFGLYDMVGSMWSWCEECFDQVVKNDQSKMIYDDTRLRDVRHNPICRGGSFKTADISALHCAYRHEDPLEGRFDCIGFRVALSLM